MNSKELEDKYKALGSVQHRSSEQLLRNNMIFSDRLFLNRLQRDLMH